MQFASFSSLVPIHVKIRHVSISEQFFRVDWISTTQHRQQRFPPEYYSSHPLVLGPGFSSNDLRLDAVNRLSYREAGVVVMGVNAPAFAAKIHGARMLRTFRVKVELIILMACELSSIN